MTASKGEIKLKKAIIGSLAALLVMGTAASAHPYKNEAFWGEWVSRSNTDENSVRLSINYIDQNTIEADFKQITDGKELFDFTEYSGKIKNEKDHIHGEFKLDYRDEYGTVKPGFAELDMYEDNIWLTVVSDDGITFFNNQLVSTEAIFNPYLTPFSYDLSISLNGEKQNLTDTKPFIIRGTTYVPLRGLLDSMNLNVYWDDTTINGAKNQFITTARNDMILQFQRPISNKGNAPWTLMGWNGDNVDTLAYPNTSYDISNRQPVIIKDRSYVPLRILSEAYGASLDWDNNTRTVLISDNIASDTKKTASEITDIQSYTISKADKAASGYAGMARYDETPRYTNRGKYFIYIQANMRYKLFNDGSVVDVID